MAGFRGKKDTGGKEYIRIGEGVKAHIVVQRHLLQFRTGCGRTGYVDFKAHIIEQRPDKNRICRRCNSANNSE